jgi:uncharacterized protein
MNPERELELSRLIKWGSVVVVILGLFLLVETLGAFKEWRGANPNAKTISVVGEGEVYAAADIATFSFAVSEDADTVSDAQSQVTSKMDAILASLNDLGVEEKDIKTSNYNIYPKYTYEGIACSQGYCPPGKQVPDGYTVSHDVTVKVRQTTDAGKILAAVGEKGATNVSGLSFTTDDPSALQEEARLEAIRDAKEKAEVLAKNLGVRLGKVITFYDNTGAYPQPMYLSSKEMAVDGRGGATAPTLPVGENRTLSNVTVVYEIR